MPTHNRPTRGRSSTRSLGTIFDTFTHDSGDLSTEHDKNGGRQGAGSCRIKLISDVFVKGKGLKGAKAAKGGSKKGKNTR